MSDQTVSDVDAARRAALPFSLGTQPSALPTFAQTNAIGSLPTAGMMGLTPNANAASPLFSHFAEHPPQLSDPLNPRKVKTQTIKPDTAGMISEIANASDLSKAELPTARDTASRLITMSGEQGVTNLNQVAYELATARRESHMGNWMNEFGGNAYFERRYGSDTKKGAELGNTEPGDGARFHGRGLVQTTGRTNYTRWTDRLTKEGVTHNGQPVDLVGHPEQAADPEIAARMAVQGMRDGGFTRYKMGDFINDKKTDYVGARRVINGQDEAQEIADQATSYQRIMERHSGDYSSMILAAQMRNLPTAHEAGRLTAPSPGSEMFAQPTPGRATSFVPPHKLLNNRLGHFTPGMAPGNVTTLKTHPVRDEAATEKPAP